jgi:heptosyltransferase-3
VLVIVTRRLGDVLLATPLVRSIKAAWPQAQVDALVFAGTEGVLAANPDLRRIVTVAERPGFLAHAGLALQLLRRYDIAVSCLTGDRPTLYAWIAGRWRAGFIEGATGARWKRWLLSRAVLFDDIDTHTVAMNLALAEALGIPPRPEVVARWSDADAERVKTLLGGGALPAYAVLHPYPKFSYKRWHADGWIGLAEWLAGRGLPAVLTGGSDAAETDFVTALAARMPRGTVNLAGKLRLAETTCVIAGARLFVGPDTATTHVAAAVGVPTVALYGPSNPVKWGPWPSGFAGGPSPWRRTGSQSAGNVELVQGAGPCVPCMGEGCDRHVASTSDCLLQLPLANVVAAAERALTAAAARRSD